MSVYIVYSNYALFLVGGGLQSPKVDTEIMSFQPIKGLEEWWCFMANLAKPEKSAKITKAADGLGDFFLAPQIVRLTPNYLLFVLNVYVVVLPSWGFSMWRSRPQSYDYI